MIAIDTNVLVCVLVNDPQADTQCQLARELLKANDAIWVCRIVLVEMSGYYKALINSQKIKLLLH